MVATFSFKQIQRRHHQEDFKTASCTSKDTPLTRQRPLLEKHMEEETCQKEETSTCDYENDLLSSEEFLME